VNMGDRGTPGRYGLEHYPHVGECSGRITAGLLWVMVVIWPPSKTQVEDGQLPHHCKRRPGTFIQMTHGVTQHCLVPK